MRKMHVAIAMTVLTAVSAFAQTRPKQPWVERVTTNDRSRQLKVAFSSSMWVLYDLPTMQLYRAWNGGSGGGTLVQPFEGGEGLPFYHRPHYPSWFTPSGATYFDEDVGEYFSSWAKPEWIDLYYSKTVVDKDFADQNLKWKPQPRNYVSWRVMNGGTNANAKVRFRGYMTGGNALKINFGLVLPDGKEVSIVEAPEVVDGKLQRKFTVANLPTGHSAVLSLAGSGWTGTGVSGKTLTIGQNGEATISGSW